MDYEKTRKVSSVYLETGGEITVIDKTANARIFLKAWF